MSQRSEQVPPGQRYALRWAIYAALGVPEVDLQQWRLHVTGLVEREREYTWPEVEQLPWVKLTCGFHCVTGWSIRDVQWEGVPFRYFADQASVKPEAQWVMFWCADGYTAPVPLEDALAEDSLIALRMNGKPLPVEQGFPARPFIPHLYGWKSAKWLTKIQFIPAYADGYWELYGYHERADIWAEERFKGQGGRHQPHRGVGTRPL